MVRLPGSSASRSPGHAISSRNIEERTMSRVNDNTKSTRPPVRIGIDLARRSVHVHGVDESGETCVDRKMTVNQLRRYLVGLPSCTVAMEACGRAHHWGRECIRMGHDVRLIAPKFVKPYVMGNRIRGLLAEFGIEIDRGKATLLPRCSGYWVMGDQSGHPASDVPGHAQ